MSAESGAASGDKADFTRKTPVEVAMFLKDNGIGSDVCDAFESKSQYAHVVTIVHAMMFFLANEIDGQAFVDLSESDVKTMTSKLGLVKKIMRLKVVCDHVNSSAFSLQ